MRKKTIRNYQDIVLRALAGKIDDFYLAGGTALSLFYFQHRFSVDLDFFTNRFSQERMEDIISYLKNSVKKRIQLIGRNPGEKKAAMFVYSIYFTKNNILKMDFVEDVIGLIKSTKRVEGIRVLSLEDIYLRKLYAVSGAVSIKDAVSRDKFLGGRMESKDLFDLYYLSNTFMTISKFVKKYGNSLMIEGLVQWVRMYDRMEMMNGIMMLDTDKEIDYRKIENHIKAEIDKLIESQVGEI